MFARIIGVFKLDAENFEEIEADSSLTLTAALIVALVGLVSGLGNGLFNGFIHKTFLGGFIGALVSVLLGWMLWSVVTWFVGTRFSTVRPTCARCCAWLALPISPWCCP